MLASFSLVFATALAMGLYLLWTMVHLWYRRMCYSGIPSPPKDEFWAGHAISMKTAKHNNTFLDLFTRWGKTYGKSFMVFSRLRPILFTLDPTILKIMTTDLVRFSKVDDLPNRSLFGQRIAGWNSILTGRGTNWAIKRKTMSKFFAKSNMEAVFNVCIPVIQNYVRSDFTKKVGNGTILDLHDELSTIFSIYPTAIGLTGFDDADIISRNVTKILEMIPKQLGDKFTLSKLLFQASQQKIETISMIIGMRSRLKKLVAEKTYDMNTEYKDTKMTDIFGHLINANIATDLADTGLDEHIVDDLMTLYLVMDNNVKQIASMFIYLTEYPTIYNTMVDEIRGIQLKDYSSLSELKYTEKVILESLRMAPALLRGTRRFASTDNKPSILGQYVLPSGTQIHFSQYIIHHDNDIWENADVFDPERWQDGVNPKPFTYIPFLAGPRGCLGKHFAMMSIKLTLVILLQRFELVPKFNEKRPPVLDQGMAVMRIRNRVNYEFTPIRS